MGGVENFSEINLGGGRLFGTPECKTKIFDSLQRWYGFRLFIVGVVGADGLRFLAVYGTV